MKKTSSFLFLSLFGLLLPATSFFATQDKITFEFQVFKPDLNSPNKPKEGNSLGNLKFSIDKANYQVSDVCDLFASEFFNSGQGVTSDSFSLWIETNENNRKGYTELNKSHFIGERSSFCLLVTDRLSAPQFIALFPEQINRTTTNAKKGWTAMQVGSAVAATVVISFAIGGVIYYFVLPKKRPASSSPPEKEQEELA